MISLPKPRHFAAMAILALALAPAASAQRQQPSPEQRLERLERQIGQLQRQVFPKGRPANTAGFPDDPAATQSSVISLSQRLDSLERQMTELLGQTEENNNLLRSIRSEVAKAREESQQRIDSLEQRITDAATAPAPSPAAGTPAKPKPKLATPLASNGSAPTAAATPLSDPGEDAYTVGFKQWQANDYGQAIASLRAFVSAYPNHRRVSYANNLIGRSLLDTGDARGAAAVLLDNYRKNPKGERAPDSLYYLGQALMKLGQPGQACKAYAELESVYGSSSRADLAKLVSDAKTEAQC